MTQISAIDVNKINPKNATYNAVKIQINNPQTNLPEGLKNLPEDNGIYNAVAIEINSPKVQVGKNHHHHAIYDYPCAECMVTSDKAPIHNIPVPRIPMFQTTNFISNKTLINAGIDSNKKNDEPKELNVEKDSLPEIETVVLEKTVTVPLPNLTTIEDEKLDNNGKLNFKGEKRPIEIIPSEDIKPSIDIHNVLKNLSSEDFDKQAQQMEEIAKVSMEDPQKAVPYIVKEVFAELIDIVQKDTSNLAKPNEKQIELRKQIIINEIIKEKALMENKDINSVELPFNITDADKKEASILSPLEQAERNKEYGLYTIAILSKIYTDEVQRHTGNVVPLTELPGISEIVDTLRFNSNPSIRVSAIDALVYLNKPEYNEDIKSVLSIASQDLNPFIAENAHRALQTI